MHKGSTLMHAKPSALSHQLQAKNKKLTARVAEGQPFCNSL
jgi:hypothetical protein